MPDGVRPGSGGLLAVHAHPDDETLSTGALLATWAASGPVTVVTCTRGERGEVIPADRAHLEGDGPALAAHREAELAQALAALSVTDHLFLDTIPRMRSAGRFEDSGMAWSGVGRAGAAAEVPEGAFVRVAVDEAAGRLASLIRDRRPDVVVGYEPGGGYGHPDHVHAHRVVHRGVELAANGEAPFRVPVLLWPVLDAAALRAGYVHVAHLADDHLLAPGDGPVPSAAVDRALVDVEVAVEPVLGAVAGALRAHATQVQAVRTWAADGVVVGCFALTNAVLQPLLATETYRYAPGWERGPVAWPAGVSLSR